MSAAGRLHVLLPPRGRCGEADWVTWLARGDRLPDAARGYLAALAGLFQWPGRTLPVAALLRERLRGDAGNDYWLCADPAHVQADAGGARMLACGTLDLDADEATELARDLRPMFGDQGALLEQTTPARWHLRMAHGARPPAFHDPEQVLGDDLVAHLPQGEDGRRWRRLLNEAQVLLHQHPSNAARRRRGRMPANCLWLWGGGELPMWMKSDVAAVFSDDVLAQAMALRCGIEPRPVARFDATARLQSDTLLDLEAADPGRAPWRAVLPLLARGYCDELRLYFADGARWRLRRWHRWRLWRRPR